MFVLVIAGYVLLGIYEFVPLNKEKRWKEFYVNLALYLVSFVMAFMISVNVKVPSPAKPIEEVIYSIFGR